MRTTIGQRIPAAHRVPSISPEQLERAHAEVAAIREEVRRRLVEDRSRLQPPGSLQDGADIAGERVQVSAV